MSSTASVVDGLLSYQCAMEHSPVCTIIVSKPAGEVVYLNKAAKAFRGETHQPLTGIDVNSDVKSWKLYTADGNLLEGKDIPIARALFNEEVVENEELQLELDSGERKWALLNASPIVEQGQVVAAAVSWFDITSRKKAEQQLFEQVKFDYLTGAYSRRHFYSLATRAYNRAIYAGLPLAVLLFDIDNFKNINDSFGHHVGDEILKSFSDHLSAKIRSNDIFARLGGEEFAILLHDAPNEYVMNIAEQLRKGIDALMIETSVGKMSITTSIGVAMLQRSDATHSIGKVEALIMQADKALYKAKDAGKNHVCVFAPE